MRRQPTRASQQSDIGRGRGRFPLSLLRDCLIIWVFCLRRNDIWWPAEMTLRGWVHETLALLQASGCLPNDA